MGCFTIKEYEIVPTETFDIIRNCSGCGGKRIFKNTNRIRMNANGKQLDVWLIYSCNECKHTYNLPIYSRIRKELLEQSEYEALQKNSLELAKKFGLSRSIFLKNEARIRKEPHYILVSADETVELIKKAETLEADTIRIWNPYQLKVRSDRLLAECLNIPRTQVKECLEKGLIKQKENSGRKIVFYTNFQH